MRKHAFAILLAFCLIELSGAFAPAWSLPKTKKTAQDHLLIGINHYESGEMEIAMESFMEVLRMGAAVEETELANEYLKRITLRLGGQSVSPKQDKKTTGSPEDKAESSATGESAQGSNQDAGAAQPPSKIAAPTAPLPAASEEALREHVERKLRSGRLHLIKLLKERPEISLALQGQDKLRLALIPEELVFSEGTAYRKDADALLYLLVELMYYHPRHLIRIFPGQTTGKSTILNLQRAAILSTYFENKGLAPERLEVDLQGEPTLALQKELKRKNIDLLYQNREKRLLVIFEEFSNPLELHHFFTRYLPKMSAGKNFPALSLGLSRQRIDARLGEGLVIEFFANSNPVDIAYWGLKLVDAGGGSVWKREGRSTTLESIYFEGRQGLDENFDLLPSGQYKIVAEALNVAGGKIQVMKEIEIIGKERAEPPKQSLEAASNASTKQGPVAMAGKMELKKPAPPALRYEDFLKGKKKKENGSSGSKKQEPKEQDIKLAGPAKAAAVPDAQIEASPDRAAQTHLSSEISTHLISYERNQKSVSSTQMDTLKKVAQAAKYYPLQRFSVLGLASPDEKEPSQLARDRAEGVARLLSKQYSVESSRINIDYGIGEKDQRQVEIFIEEQ